MSSKKRLNQIYSLPLPLKCHPLPAFIPHNPLSMVRIAYALVAGYFWPSSSHPSSLYAATLCVETQSVHVTDPIFVRDLWEKGFFGKGTLSRSDPSWLDREKRKRGLAAQQTSEELTMNRRDERRQMKFERALKERETIESQLRKEGKMGDLATNHVNGYTSRNGPDPLPTSCVASAAHSTALTNHMTDDISFSEAEENVEESFPAEINDQEHLQLSPEEAFFLVFGLGVLQVYDVNSKIPLSTGSLLAKLRSISYSPAADLSALRPDDPFLLNYVVYHHFRSMGWVVRGGSKFSVDYLLYKRGPVFSHAEFAVLVLPSYSDPYWKEPSRRMETRLRENREWHWLHCINRVQTHVHKTLVLAYVDIPAPPRMPPRERSDQNIGKLLKEYKVREFVLRRWLFNRSRD